MLMDPNLIVLDNSTTTSDKYFHFTDQPAYNIECSQAHQTELSSNWSRMLNTSLIVVHCHVTVPFPF